MSGPQRADIIGDLILDEFANTEEGHCARVDFLERAESHAVCAVLRDSALGRSGDLCAFVLRPSAASAEHDPELDSVISADQAIERRNRKQERLCLFVPADIVDAAASSLGNAFAPIDGRDLHVQALGHLLAHADEALSDTARRCFSRLRGQLRASETAKLDFFAGAAQRFEGGQPECIGLELWRVGLLPDGGEDFQDRLDQNVRYVRELSQPQRVQAQLRERIQKLGVDEVTAGALLQFLHGRALNDVRAWARDIAATPLTLDRWVFPTQDRTDLRSVAVKSFLDVNGVVRKTSKLTQPFGASGALVANVGPKQKISIAWSSDPLRPSNLARWRVEIVPVSGELDDTTASLPSREVPSRRDSATLSLDLDLNADEIPNTMMWVRVLPLDAAGNEVLDDRGEPIVGTSEEFFLTEGESVAGETGRLKTVPTLPFGRLQALLKNAENIDEGQPQWVSRDLDYFTLRLNDRILVRVGLSPSLRALEGQVLNHPRQGGRYRLEVEDASAVDAAAFVQVAPPPSERDRWAAFWRARETFFRGVGRAEARSLIEVADWTPELANSAVRYAQAYRELVEELTARSGDDKRELIDALSLDTVYVRTLGAGGDDEIALLVLPTHPLRAAWFAGYSQLLLRWETQVAERAAASQPRTVDLELLEQLAPSNAPPFAHWPELDTPFVFFQNLLFFHGIALPPAAADPHRRFADVARILGAGADSSAGDLRPHRLADHLREYQALHDYADRLELALINPDRGDLIADTLESFIRQEAAPQDEPDEHAGRPTTFGVHAYVASGRETPLTGLERVRRVQMEDYRVGEATFLLPALEASVKTMADLDEVAPVEVHLAIASDLAQPRLTTVARVTGARRTSFSMHGLIARFVSHFSAEGDAMRWLHHFAVDPAARPEPHPAGARLGDALMDLHGSLLSAGARVLGAAESTVPALEVRITPERRRLIESLHQQSDWVISVDRFFGPDYYDSPGEPHLSDASRKYLLDFTPDFGEGLGHRLIVTTAWQDEVIRRLRDTIVQIGLAPQGDAPGALLDQLKVLSGRFALRALTTPTGGADIASLAAVIAWLRARNRLTQAILVPVNFHGHLFGDPRVRIDRGGEEYCECMLVSLRRNIVEATMIAVRWRRGEEDLEDLAYDMLLPLERTERLMSSRFFDENRVDGSLQRARFTSVLRFYFERAQRYGLLDAGVVSAFLDHLGRLEKTGLDFRAKYEGYIVAPSGPAIAPFALGDARITVLRPDDLAMGTLFSPRDRPDTLTQLAYDSGSASEESNNGSEIVAETTSGVDGDATESLVDLDDGAESDNKPGPEWADGPTALEHLPEGEAPNAERPTRSPILLGTSKVADTPVLWQPGVQGSPHMFVLGIPGQGKSWTVARAAGELSKQGVPALIFRTLDSGP